MAFGARLSERTRHRIPRFAGVFPAAEIVHALRAQLSWTWTPPREILERQPTARPHVYDLGAASSSFAPWQRPFTAAAEVCAPVLTRLDRIET